MELWYRRTFRLAPTDPRYLDATIDEMGLEKLCHEYDDLRIRLEKEGRSLDDFVEDVEYDSGAVEQAMLDDDAWQDLIRVGPGATED